MSIVRNVCVYCGSSPGSDPRFGEAADQLGLAMAAAGVGLVFGGGDAGLMGRIARSVLAGGGRVTGIIPRFLMKSENALLDAQDLIVVDDMHQRKQLMFDRADAFVALPGGIGTLEELVEQLTWVQLARHRKPVLLADIGGFWRPLLELIAHMHNLGFLRDGFDVHYLVAEKVDDVLPMLAAAAKSRGGDFCLNEIEERFPSRLFGAKVTLGESAVRKGGVPREKTGMTGSWLKNFALAAFLLGALAAGGAWAQTTPAAPAAPDAAPAADDAVAKPKPKLKPKAVKPKEPKRPSVAVVVTNSRKVGLTELDGALVGADSVKILGALAAGKKTVIHVAHDKSCVFDLHGVFDDLTTADMSSVDLCADKKINLVE